MKTFLTGLAFLILVGTGLQGQQPQSGPRPAPPHAGNFNGKFWIGHRFSFDKYTGWGWIREEKDNWKKGRWVIFEETPGVIVAPHRGLASKDADNNYEYRVWGYIAPYKGYEPNYDVFVDVFVLQGWQVLGPAEPLKLQPPVRVVKTGRKKTQSSPIAR